MKHGSHHSTEFSDIDLLLLVDNPGNYLANTSWISQFDEPVRQQVEE